VVVRVCSKQGGHSLSGVSIQVVPYFQCLGLPAGCVPEKCDDMCVFLDAETCEANKLKFLRRNAAMQNIAEAQLHSLHAAVKSWSEDPITIECLLAPNMPDYRKLKTDWEKKVQDALQDILEEIAVNERSVEADMWSEMLDEVRKLNITHPDDVVLASDKTSCKFVLISKKDKMGVSWAELTQALDRAVQRVKQSRNKVNKDIKMNKWKIKYIENAEFPKRFQSVDIKFDAPKGQILVSGSQKHVDECVLAMYQAVEGVKGRDFSVESGYPELLNNKRISDYVSREMKRQQLSDVWDVSDDRVTIYTDDDADFNKMKNIIMNSVSKVTVSVDRTLKEVIQSQKWQTVEQELKQKSKGCLVVIFNQNKNELQVFTSSDMQNTVQEAVSTFCETNAIYKEEMSVEVSRAKFMWKHMDAGISGQLNKLKASGLAKWEIQKGGKIFVEGRMF